MSSRGDVPEWRRYVVVHGQFGERDNQYGHEGIEDTPAAIILVGCFTASGGEIFVHDVIKRDVKVYSRAGEFQRVFPVDIMAESIAVLDDRVFLLYDNHGGRSGDAGDDWTRLRLYEYDRLNGDFQRHIPIYSREIAVLQDSTHGPVLVSGSAQLVTGHGEVLVYDSVTNKSYPIIQADRVLTRDEQGTHRLGSYGVGPIVRQRTRQQGVDFVDDSGKTVKGLVDHGVLVDRCGDGHYAAVRHTGQDDARIDIVDLLSETVIGQCVRSFGDKRGRFPFEALFDSMELTCDGYMVSLLEVFCNDEGVFVVEWRP